MGYFSPSGVEIRIGRFRISGKASVSDFFDPKADVSFFYFIDVTMYVHDMHAMHVGNPE